MTDVLLKRAEAARQLGDDFTAADYLEMRNAIIEECARVAERHAINGDECFAAWHGHDKTCELIAAAIRALKDKP